MTDVFSDADDTLLPESLEQSVSLLSKKWHPAIIRCLATSDGLGYSDLETQLHGISAKVLTDALSALQEHDIVDRTEVSQHPLRVQYTLTARGTELNAVIQSLADWGATHLDDDSERVVLIADDDARVSNMHETWLEDEYTVLTARDGKETLDKLTTDVDVIVLDRRMPGLTGDEVLNWVRSQQYDTRVVMATAENPDVGILEMEFDEYLTKPILKDELRSVVSDLIERADYDEPVRRYLALRSKLGLLEATVSADTLADDDEYSRYQEQLETLSDDIEDVSGVAETALEKMEPPNTQ
jgi:DNA-binding HxlR family transcriptional regulator/DNA-binding NarL/FixJ family response regulator